MRRGVPAGLDEFEFVICAGGEGACSSRVGEMGEGVSAVVGRGDGSFGSVKCGGVGVLKRSALESGFERVVFRATNFGGVEVGVGDLESLWGAENWDINESTFDDAQVVSTTHEITPYDLGH